MIRGFETPLEVVLALPDPDVASKAAGSKFDPILESIVGLIGAAEYPGAVGAVTGAGGATAIDGLRCIDVVTGAVGSEGVMLDFLDPAFGLGWISDRFVTGPLLIVETGVGMTSLGG